MSAPKHVVDLLDAPGPADEPGEVDDLALVRVSLDAEQLEQALDQLVACWGRCRNPQLAAAIERLGLMVDEQQPPAGRAAWQHVGECPAPHQVGPLLASLREGKLAEVEARIEMLVDWLPDPRVTTVLMLIIGDYMLGARDRLWRGVYEALVVHADPRVADRVRDRHDRLADARVVHRHISEGRAVRRVFDTFVAAVSIAHELDDRQQVHADAIDHALAMRLSSSDAAAELERELIEAIIAEWESEAPRTVYADWLQSRSDPRGEFIALELALARGDASKKIKSAHKAWLKRHQPLLFGPIAGLVSWGPEFERGLLTGVRVQTRTGALNVAADLRDAMLTDLRWATVRCLHVDYDDVQIAELFERAPLLALDELERPNLEALQGFARRSQPVLLRTLEVSASPDDGDDDWQRFGQLSRALPRLESLEIMIWGRSGGRVTPPHSCFAGELVRRAAELRNGDTHTGGVARLDQWLARMIATKCPVPLLRVVGPELSAEVRQLALGRFELQLRFDLLRWAHDAEELAVIVECLRGLPRDNIEGVRVRYGDVTPPNRAAIEEALEGLEFEYAT